MGSTDIAVQGLHIMPAMLLRHDAFTILTEKAMLQTTTQMTQQEDVPEISLSRSTVLHCRKLATEQPTEVFFSETDIWSLFVCMLLVVCACLLYDMRHRLTLYVLPSIYSQSVWIKHEVHWQCTVTFYQSQECCSLCLCQDNMLPAAHL